MQRHDNRRSRRGAVLAAALASLVGLSAGGCISIDFDGTMRSPGRVNHVVLCWLKNPRDTATRDEIIRVSRSFQRIPGVVGVRAGTALPSGRAIVDDSYDIGLVITCRDREALQAYLDHPRHREAAEALIRPAARKILVYDIVE